MSSSHGVHHDPTMTLALTESDGQSPDAGDSTWQSDPKLTFAPLVFGLQDCPLAEDTPVPSGVFVIRSHTDQIGARRRLLAPPRESRVKLLAQSWTQMHMISQRRQFSQALLQPRARARA
ncbi:hypothetical protein LA080_006685 [Diaporthe eres]|nr:hypothetical protein LA080_006685 [Diaporthe eres]